MVLVWFRKNEDIALLAAGFGVSRATGYRYVAEGCQRPRKDPRRRPDISPLMAT